MRLWSNADELKANSMLKASVYSLLVLGVLYLPENARFSNLIKLPEGNDIGNTINDAMKAIESENKELKGVLAIGAYTKLERGLYV